MRRCGVEGFTLVEVLVAQMALPNATNPYLQLDYDADDGAPDALPMQCFSGADLTFAKAQRVK